MVDAKIERGYPRLKGSTELIVCTWHNCTFGLIFPNVCLSTRFVAFESLIIKKRWLTMTSRSLISQLVYVGDESYPYFSRRS